MQNVNCFTPEFSLLFKKQRRHQKPQMFTLYISPVKAPWEPFKVPLFNPTAAHQNQLRFQFRTPSGRPVPRENVPFAFHKAKTSSQHGFKPRRRSSCCCSVSNQKKSERGLSSERADWFSVKRLTYSPQYAPLGHSNLSRNHCGIKGDTQPVTNRICKKLLA